MRRFEVDRSEGKFLGVCAGLGSRLGIDPTIVRIAAVLAAIFGSFFWTALVYAVLAIVGQPHGAGRRAERARRPLREETRERMRSLDLRMQAIETHAAAANSRLAREIEDLR